MALPGIGASRAADIVRYREQNGAFQTKEDIMKVSGIKQNAYDKLCDKITVPMRAYAGNVKRKVRDREVKERWQARKCW